MRRNNTPNPQINEKIGEGNFGKIFKGINITNNKQLAIKIQYKDIVNEHDKYNIKVYG